MEKHNSFRPYRKVINEYVDEIESGNGDESILSTAAAKTRCIELLEKKHHGKQYRQLAEDSFSLLIPSVFSSRGYNSVIYGGGFYIKGASNSKKIYVTYVIQNTETTAKEKLKFLNALRVHSNDIPGQRDLWGNEVPSQEDILEELRADYENQEVAV